MTLQSGELRAASESMPASAAWIRDGSFVVPLAGLILVLALQVTMVFTRAINWDEFYHYAQIQLFTQGVLSQPLQTFYVRLFQWLPGLPGTSVDHIVVARLFIFLCEIVAASATAVLATRFTDRTTGLLCALAYVSSGFVLQHGFSLRADSVDAALLMSALCILGCTRFRGGWVLLFGALIAVAALYTIKFVLYAPAFIGLAWWRWQGDGYRPAFIYRLLVSSFVAAVLFGCLYAYHSRIGVVVARSSETVLTQSADRMFQLGIPFYWRYIVKSALLSPVLAAMILAFPFALRRFSVDRASKIALAGLLLPIGVLAFYHNTAPYFYAFILAPVAAACAVPIAMTVRRYGAAVVTILFVATAALIWMVEARDVIGRQRILLQAADSIFPHDIAYFDFCAMLAGFEKANVFMTPWGGGIYRAGGSPSMRDIMRDKVVPLVVENDPMFRRLLRTREPAPEFLASDAETLRQTYLPFWGPFWVAGQLVHADGREHEAEFMVPGPYTVSGGVVRIDGGIARPGQTIRIERGMHRLTVLGGSDVRLIWGDHLKKPTEAAPPEPYWQWF